MTISASYTTLRDSIQLCCYSAPDQSHPPVLHLRLYREMVIDGMLRSLLRTLFRTGMVWMVAISLLASGFSHQPLLTAGQIDQATYLAELGLSEADLCAEPGDAGGGMDMGDCPACHLSASILLPDPVSNFIDIELRTVAAVLVPAETRVFGRTTNPATPVRAPPLA